jgi:16S rRNA (guanine(966)-N(2))-methyltransferase RsmD
MIKNNKKDDIPFGLKNAKGSTRKLRISSGQFKNIQLIVPESARPTMEKVKLAIFSLIDGYVENAQVLDLFAGSGSLGFEALSRGAASCDFIDNDYFAIKCIRDNIDKINATFQIELKSWNTKEDSLKYIANTDKNYTLVFLDPPYDQNTHKHIFKLLHEIVRPGGIIVYLSNHTNEIFEKLENINPNLEVIDSRRYGITHVDIIKVKSQEAINL